MASAPKDWKEEYEELANNAPVVSINELIPTNQRTISLQMAEKFVSFLLDTEDVFSAALQQKHWLSIWSERPESELQAPRKAHDYPLNHFFLTGKFRDWFSLKYDINNNGSLFLSQIQQVAVGWFLEKNSRPEDEVIREKLLKLDFLKWETSADGN